MGELYHFVRKVKSTCYVFLVLNSYKRIIIEETCKAQITVFDACTALVPVDDDSDYEVNDECQDDIEAARNDGNCDFCKEDTGGKNSVFEKQQIAAARILSDEVFGKMCGSLWLNGCGEDGTPVLGEDGSGVYLSLIHI